MVSEGGAVSTAGNGNAKQGGLTAKQRVFVAEYVTDFNATRAAIAAGYSKKTAYSVGWENLRKPEIASEIERVISDRCMSKHEVLIRLAEQARAEYSAYISDNGTVNTAALVRDGKAHLIKAIKETPSGRNIEFYDTQAALVHLGRHHKLFSDRVEHTGKDGGPIQTETTTKPDLSKLTLDELRLLRNMVAKTDATAQSEGD